MVILMLTNAVMDILIRLVMRLAMASVLMKIKSQY